MTNRFGGDYVWAGGKVAVGGCAFVDVSVTTRSGLPRNEPQITVCVLSVLSVYCLCTVCILSVYCLCTVCVLSVLSVYCLCALCVLSVLSVYSLYTLCILSVYSLCTRPAKDKVEEKWCVALPGNPCKAIQTAKKMFGISRTELDGSK
jgi:hypothetical protein